MRCSKVTQLISPYIDNELSQKERKLIELHIKECGSCATAIEEIRNMQNLFAHAERFSAPYGFATRVITNVAANKEERPWFLLTIRLAEAVVLMMILGLGTISGNFLASNFPAAKGENLVSSLALDIFNATPPDSLGGVYLAMTEGENEKH